LLHARIVDSHACVCTWESVRGVFVRVCDCSWSLQEAQNLNHSPSNTLAYGVMGSATSIPAQFSLETILYLGTGINSVTEGWGNTLLARYGKDRSFADRDLTVRGALTVYPLLFYLPGCLPGCLSSCMCALLCLTPRSQLTCPVFRFCLICCHCAAAVPWVLHGQRVRRGFAVCQLLSSSPPVAVLGAQC
jgi:hypothetical protein